MSKKILRYISNLLKSDDLLEKKTQTKGCRKIDDKMKDRRFKSKGEGYFFYKLQKGMLE